MATRRSLVVLPAVALVLSGCSLVGTPSPPSVKDASLAPTGPVGYVVCPAAVTPVELDTATPEAAIALPLPSPAPIGNFAIATSPDGRWAYVVTTFGGTAAATPTVLAGGPSTAATADGAAGNSEVIPIDLVSQRAGQPIPLPGLGGTHAILVLPGGRTVLAGDGTAIVPVDVASRRVGTPIDLGAGHTVYGLALAPAGTTLYALVPGGVFPVDTVHGSAGPEIPTGLAISSVYSPHGIAVTADGATVYVAGQGGADFGGRVLPIVTATRATLQPTGFDRYRHRRSRRPGPGRRRFVDAGGRQRQQLDQPGRNGHLYRSSATRPAAAAPGSTSTSGTEHPTDIVTGPGGTGVFIVDGFTSLIPYQPATQRFGRPVAVCSGASSMAIAPAP